MYLKTQFYASACKRSLKMPMCICQLVMLANIRLLIVKLSIFARHRGWREGFIYSHCMVFGWKIPFSTHCVCQLNDCKQHPDNF